MIKLELEEFVEEIKAEMYGYEEIEESMINDWEDRFRAWVAKVKDKKIKNDRIKFGPNSIKVELKDETDIFKIVDKFLVAVTHNEIDKYFIDWQL
ncbi:hypothetical protein [Vallitalea guaymasensis]|uniref:Uncharacterized protein n=1 Tax=Vallitalea guaymasensis TaxID=1185412 RepID=A0A8J8MC88_9FIRM|nr:hypothetical protein [Vallitalea guaymasensis]QUH30246.1 hypothetical protein HYG85_15565 [Vallitalea guaymasensis]